MKRNGLTLSLALIFTMTLFLGSASAKGHRPGHVSRRAARVDTPWEHKADRNHDGYVGPHEADKAKKDYIKNKSVVDSPWEKKADRNRDGIVGPHEAEKAKHDFTAAPGNGK